MEAGSNAPSEIKLAATLNDGEKEGQVSITREEGEHFFRTSDGYHMKKDIYTGRKKEPRDCFRAKCNNGVRKRREGERERGREGEREREGERKRG